MSSRLPAPPNVPQVMSPGEWVSERWIKQWSSRRVAPTPGSSVPERPLTVSGRATRLLGPSRYRVRIAVDGQEYRGEPIDGEVEIVVGTPSLNPPPLETLAREFAEEVDAIPIQLPPGTTVGAEVSVPAFLQKVFQDYDRPDGWHVTLAGFDATEAKLSIAYSSPAHRAAVSSSYDLHGEVVVAWQSGRPLRLKADEAVRTFVDRFGGGQRVSEEERHFEMTWSYGSQ